MQRKCDQRKIAEIWVEGCWQKYDLHFSYVEMMNMDALCMHLIFRVKEEKK